MLQISRIFPVEIFYYRLINYCYCGKLGKVSVGNALLFLKTACESTINVNLNVQFRDTAIENKSMDTEGEGGLEQLGGWDRHIYTSDTVHKIDNR